MSLLTPSRPILPQSRPSEAEMCAQAQDQDALNAAEMTYFGKPGQPPLAFLGPVTGDVYMNVEGAVAHAHDGHLFLVAEYAEKVARWFEQVAPIIRDRRKAYAARATGADGVPTVGPEVRP